MVACAGVLALPAIARAQLDGVSSSEARRVISDVDSELSQMRDDFDVVARGYGTPVARDTRASVERRLREGEIHFLLNDFLRASIVLIDVVESPENRTHPKYDECMYLLGESLRRTENYSGARTSFEDLLQRATGDRLKDVVLALLEIASATQRYENVEGYIARLRQAGGLSRPDVDYIHGKMLFRSAGGDRGQLTRALETFNSIPATTAVAPQSSYYAGVVLVSLGNNEGAIAKFTEAADRAAKGANGSAIRELSYLALGRVHHEMGDVAKAVDAYQQIRQTSPHFSDMLFEVAWTYVKAANKAEDPEQKTKALNLALRMSEILMAAAPDHRLFPEARILEGNLQIRLGAPETAYDTFQTIIDRYGGAREKLQQLMTNIGDPKEFFEQIVSEDLRSVGSTTFLPPIAVEWAVRSDEVRQAVSTIEDLREAKAYLRESRDLVRTMNEALRGEQRYQLFSGLAEARAKAFSIENRLIILNRRLLNLERQMIGENVDPRTYARLELQAAQRRSMEEEVQKLPQTIEQVESSSDKISDKYAEVDRRVFRQTYQVASMRAQVAAVDVWLSQNRNQLSDKEVELMSKRTTAGRKLIADLEDDIDSLQSDIRTARAVSGGDGGRVRAHRIRDAYGAMVSTEIEGLRGLRSNIRGDLSGTTSQIDQHRAALAKMGADLRKLQAALDEQIEDKVSEVRSELLAELARLDTYEKEHVGLGGETDRILGPLAAASLSAVAREFKTLVRKADVGIIDVAWARKQAESKRVGKLLEEQQTQILELENEFADVIEDE